MSPAFCSRATDLVAAVRISASETWAAPRTARVPPTRRSIHERVMLKYCHQPRQNATSYDNRSGARPAQPSDVSLARATDRHRAELISTSFTRGGDESSQEFGPLSNLFAIPPGR